jgi:HK97 family phage major capsid protein
MLLFEKKKERAAVVEKLDAILAGAERGHRAMTHDEEVTFNTEQRKLGQLTQEIERMERQSSIRNVAANGQIFVDGAPTHSSRRKSFSAQYLNEQMAWLASRGQRKGEAIAPLFDDMGGLPLVGMSATSYEGSNTAGGFAVPSYVEPQVVPLGTPDIGVQSIATVIPTVADLKFPRQTAFGTAAAKAESGASNNAFAGTDTAIDQFTLTANMVGHLANASWELLQDVPVWQSFLTQDILLSIAILKEGYFVSGTGSGQPQGLLGNVGTGITGATADSAGNLLSIQATFDVLGTLKSYYFNQNTRWLMAHATGIELRKAQLQSNLFSPVFTSQNGKDYLHGIEIAYSSSMPAIAAGATPVLVGDFKAGYIIGLRGGEGVNVKILDQPLASVGLLQILGYQRVDGRVRRSEAIQGITLHT